MRSLLAKTTPLLVLLAAAPVTSQNAAVLRQRHQAKLAEGWVSHAGWITDLTKARAEAQRTGKPIFAYFTRSYAT